MCNWTSKVLSFVFYRKECKSVMSKNNAQFKQLIITENDFSSSQIPCSSLDQNITGDISRDIGEGAEFLSVCSGTLAESGLSFPTDIGG